MYKNYIKSCTITIFSTKYQRNMTACELFYSHPLSHQISNTGLPTSVDSYSLVSIRFLCFNLHFSSLLSLIKCCQPSRNKTFPFDLPLPLSTLILSALYLYKRIKKRDKSQEICGMGGLGERHLLISF